jgi:protein TonB
MKRQSLFLFLSVCAHTGLLLTLSVSMQVSTDSSSNRDNGKPFSLVNIAVQEEAVPPLSLSAPRPAAPPNPALPPVPGTPDTALAEQYLEQEEEPAQESEETENSTGDAAEPSGQAAGFAEGPAVSPGNSGMSPGNAALTADYARRNYTYIQRRIRDRLVYPSPARRAGIQGVAEIAFTIHENGRVSAVTVQKSSGSAVLDDAAVDAVLAAAPFPRPPAPARRAIPVSFRLTNR